MARHAPLGVADDDAAGTGRHEGRRPAASPACRPGRRACRLAAARALERFAVARRLPRLRRATGQRPRRRAAVEVAAETVDTVRGTAGPRLRRGCGADGQFALSSLRKGARPPGSKPGRCTPAGSPTKSSALHEAAREQQPAAPQYTPEQLQDLAFGAYVGLVREQGGSVPGGLRHRGTGGARPANGPRTPSGDGDGRRPPCRRRVPVMRPGAGRSQPGGAAAGVRPTRGTGDGRRHAGGGGAGAGHTDVGVRGLEKMAGGGTSRGGAGGPRRGAADAHRRPGHRGGQAARRSAWPRAGRRIWRWARRTNRCANKPSIGSPPSTTVRRSARPAAAGAAIAPSQGRDRGRVRPGRQERRRPRSTPWSSCCARPRKRGRSGALIEALKGLGDPRAADAFLDRIENDPEGTALVGELFPAAGDFRRPRDGGSAAGDG